MRLAITLRLISTKKELSFMRLREDRGMSRHQGKLTLLLVF